MHYFSREQDSEFNPSKITFQVSGVSFDFFTASGVFSRRNIDRASRLLIEHAEIVGTKVLDLGCGWGSVGICLKVLNPELDIFLSDINLRALKLTRMNKKLNRVSVSIVDSDGFNKLEKVDTVLFNPPQTAGKKVWQRLILETKDNCKNLQVVARHNKGGKSISAFMEETFGNVHVVKRKSGYRIYASLNNSS
jgi:16S rRNA G1207 methylase RsmC